MPDNFKKISFDIQGAFDSGASTQEIAQFLSNKMKESGMNFDYKSAKEAGASDDDVISFLAEAQERTPVTKITPEAEPDFEEQSFDRNIVRKQDDFLELTQRIDKKARGVHSIADKLRYENLRGAMETGNKFALKEAFIDIASNAGDMGLRELATKIIEQFSPATAPAAEEKIPVQTPEGQKTLGESALNFLALPGKATLSGVSGIAAAAGTVLEYAGTKIDSELLKEAGQTTAEHWQKVREEFKAPEEIRGAVYKNPALLKKPAWWIYNVFETLPSMAASMIPAVGAAKYIGVAGAKLAFNEKTIMLLSRMGSAISGGLTGGSLEGASTFREVLRRGGSRKEAAHAGEMMTLVAGGLNAISLEKMLGKGGVLKPLYSGITEAITEWAEEPAEAVILGDSIVQASKDGINVLGPSLVLGMLGGSTNVSTQLRRNEAIEEMNRINETAAPSKADIIKVVDKLTQVGETINKEREIMQSVYDLEKKVSEALEPGGLEKVQNFKHSAGLTPKQYIDLLNKALEGDVEGTFLKKEEEHAPRIPEIEEKPEEARIQREEREKISREDLERKAPGEPGIPIEREEIKETELAPEVREEIEVEAKPEEAVVTEAEILPEEKPMPVTEKEKAIVETTEGIKEAFAEKNYEHIAVMDTKKIKTAPEELQYKTEVGPEGITGLLKGVKEYDPKKAGIISVWRNPADNEVYVVNGHHRHNLADRTGHPSELVQFIKADTIEQARAQGALLNISEGRGTAIDAAKFIRDTKFTVEEFSDANVSLKEKILKDGVALSNLAPTVFQRVINKTMEQNLGVMIGENLEMEADQLALLKILDKQEKKGRTLTQRQVKELIRQVKQTEKAEMVEETLFGTETIKKNVLLEKSVISEYTLAKLKTDKNLLKSLTPAKAAKIAEKEVGKIEIEKAKEEAGKAELLLEFYNRESTYKGTEINSILNKYATQLAKGEINERQAKERAYTEIRQSLSSIIEGRKEKGVRAVEKEAAREEPITTEKEELVKMHAGIDIETATEAFKKIKKQWTESKLSDYLEAIVRSATIMIDPASLSVEAKDMDAITAASIADIEQKKNVLWKQSEEAKNAWDEAPKDIQLAVIIGMEEEVRMPKIFKNIAAGYRKRLANVYKREIDSGIYLNYIEDYFPHIWKDTKKAKKFFNGLKRKLGTDAFTKHRTVDLIRKGLDFGLELKTTNPEEMVLIRELTAERVIGLENMLKESADYGYIQKLEGIKIKPGEERQLELWETIRKQEKKIEGKSIIAPSGDVYIVPEEVYQIFSNAILQPSWWTDPSAAGDFYRGAMKVKNDFVLVKLGVSLFHFTHIMMSDFSSRAAIVLEHSPLIRKTLSWKESCKELIKGVNQFKSRKEGQIILNAWDKHPSERTATENQAVQYIVDGGGSAKAGQVMRAKMMDAFKKAVKKGNYPLAALEGFPAILEAISSPVMDYYIPSMKISYYLKEVEMALKHDPSLTDNKRKRCKKFRKLWKQADNRYGQVFYKTLFWNRALKEAGIASSLSLGWNLGLVREVTGTGKGIVGAFDYVINKNPEMLIENLPHLVWAATYSSTAVIVGALLNLALTGKPPEEPKDYLYPRTGDINPDGTPARLNTPFYTKELPSLIEHYRKEGIIKGPTTYFTNKMAPVWAVTARMIANKDYYGTEIRNEFDLGHVQAWALTKYFLQELTPISINAMQRAHKVSGNKGAILAFVGFSPAPKYISRTKMQKQIFDAYSKKRGYPSRTQEESKELKLKRDAKEAYWKGNDEKAQELFKKTTYKKSYGDVVENYWEIPSDVSVFNRLNETDQMRLLKKMSVQDIRRYVQHLNDNIQTQFLEKPESISPQAERFLTKYRNGTIELPIWHRGKDWTGTKEKFKVKEYGRK